MSLTAELFCLMKESYNTDPKQEFSQYKEFNDMRSELGAAPRETLEQMPVKKPRKMRQEAERRRLNRHRTLQKASRPGP